MSKAQACGLKDRHQQSLQKCTKHELHYLLYLRFHILGHGSFRNIIKTEWTRNYGKITHFEAEKCI